MGLSNRVLSCASCNGDEKRERDWREFLREKNADADVFDLRCLAIERWVAKGSVASRTVVDLELLKREIDRAIGAFDMAVQNLRASRSGD
jgi:hypothetical protein